MPRGVGYAYSVASVVDPLVQGGAQFNTEMDTQGLLYTNTVRTQGLLYTNT